MTRQLLLEIKNFSLSFKGKERDHLVYENACLSVGVGETIGLLGPSGSGKSALAKAIFNGLRSSESQSSGVITFLDQTGKPTQLFPAKVGRNHHIYGQDICMVFQEPSLAFNPVLTIGHQIAEVIVKHQRIDKSRARDLTLSAMEKVGLNDPAHLKKYPHELSGGQLQRFMLLMAVVNEPKLLVADEPTTSLDSIHQKEVLDLLRERQRQGTALLIISHDVGVLKYLNAQIYKVNEYKIAPYGPKPSLNISIENRAKKKGALVLDVEISHIKYRDFLAVGAIDFQLKSNEILGIVGPSGCGKSTLAKGICGLLPLSGSVSPTYPKGKIQMIFQHPGAALDPTQSIGNAVMEALKVSGVRNKKIRRSKCEALFNQVGLAHTYMGHYPHQMSGGMKQRACIARALATSPKVLICDEAVSSLDADLKVKIVNLLISLSRDHDMSLIFISHDLALVEQLCNRILVMDKGVIVDEVESVSGTNRVISGTMKLLMEARL